MNFILWCNSIQYITLILNAVACHKSRVLIGSMGQLELESHDEPRICVTGRVQLRERWHHDGLPMKLSA
jgi:hypothetical protein